MRERVSAPGPCPASPYNPFRKPLRTEPRLTRLAGSPHSSTGPPNTDGEPFNFQPRRLASGAAPRDLVGADGCT